MKKLLIFVVIIGVIFFSINYFKHAGYEARPITSFGVIIGSFSDIIAQSKIIYSTTNSYQTVCSDSAVLTELKNAKNESKDGPKCFSDNDSFVVATQLKKSNATGTHFCADSNNTKKYITKEQYDLISNSNTLCL